MMKQVRNAFLLVLLGLSGVAQESVMPKVAIPLIASGSHHRPTSVTVESLVITDQKIPVSGASLLRGADFPVELGVLIDASNSQGGAHLDDILKAMTQFVGEIIRSPEDHVFFLQFDATQRATPWLKKEQLQGNIIKVGIGGGTAIYDAIGMACNDRMGPRDWWKTSRRIFVLISDGEDNLSHITLNEALAEALNAGVVIITINSSSYKGGDRGEKIMENLAMLTGGEPFSGVSPQDMPKPFASIKELIDSMYYRSYVPPEAAKTAVHEVEVKPIAKEKFKLSYARKYLWNQ
jgi:VWFA-related protein